MHMLPDGPALAGLLAIGLLLVGSGALAWLVRAHRHGLPWPTRWSLRTGLTLTLLVVAALPLALLAVVAAERAAEQRIEAAAAATAARAEALAQALAVDPEPLVRRLNASAALPANGPVLVADPGWRLRTAQGAPAAADQAQILLAAARDATLARVSLPRVDGKADDYLVAAAATASGWHVVSATPLAPITAAQWRDRGVMLGWSLGAGIVAALLALAVAARVGGPLHDLDRALRRFDPEFDPAPPVAPAGAPREVVLLFEQLAAINQRIHEAFTHLRGALRASESARHELGGEAQARADEAREREEDLQQAHVALARVIRVDPMTGLANRRWFAEFLDRAWRSAQRRQLPLSVLTIDIDHLRALREARGREDGDTCIQAVANVISHVVGRATDLASHDGSGQFVVLLGDSSLEGALQVAEQVRSAVAKLAIACQSGPSPGAVTVSVGVSSVLPARGARSNALLAASEHALESAKALGRNRVAYSMAAHTGLYQSLCLANDPAPRPS